MEWKIYDGAECFICKNQSQVEVNTVSKEKNWVYDDEEARCTKCGETGYIVADGEIADVIWDNDDND